MANKLVDQSTYEMNDLEAGHATGSSFGTVKVSDSYSETGTAADGLVPSQKALSDATKAVKYTGYTIYSHNSQFGFSDHQCWRNGNTVHVDTQIRMVSNSSAAMTIFSGLPKSVHAFDLNFVNANNSYVVPISVDTDGNIKVYATDAFGWIPIHITYLTND